MGLALSVRLIESQKKKGEKKGVDQLSVRLIEVSLKRESTVIQRKCSYQWNPLRLAYSTTLT